MSEEAWLIIQNKVLPPQVARLTPDFTIGRVQGNDLVLPFGNVSKRHARLVLRERRWIVVNVAANRMWVNGQELSSRPRVLQDRDKIYIGDSTLTFRNPLPVIFDVRRHGAWLTVNEPGGLVCPAVDTTSTATRLVSAVRGAQPVGVGVLDRLEGLTFVEDIAGVPFTHLLAATPDAVRIDPAVLAQVASAALQSSSATNLADTAVSPWLTFDGRVVPMAPMGSVDVLAPTLMLRTLADLLEPGLSSLEALTGRCTAEPAPPAEHVRGLLANVLPDVRAAHTRVVEEVGLIGVEGLRAMAPPER